jgi:acyl-coenzyme A thioesterase PaaI-like protein
VIASLADNAMGISVHRAAEWHGARIESGALTLGLPIDFLAPAQQGNLIEVRSRVHFLGRSIGVVDCLLVDGDEHVVAHGNATFRYRSPDR